MAKESDCTFRFSFGLLISIRFRAFYKSCIAGQIYWFCQLSWDWLIWANLSFVSKIAYIENVSAKIANPKYASKLLVPLGVHLNFGSNMWIRFPYDSILENLRAINHGLPSRNWWFDSLKNGIINAPDERMWRLFQILFITDMSILYFISSWSSLSLACWRFFVFSLLLYISIRVHRISIKPMLRR